MLMSLPECFLGPWDWIARFCEFASTHWERIWFKLTPQADFCPDAQYVMPKPHGHHVSKAHLY